MGGAVPGDGFFLGFWAAPLFAGLVLGWLERFWKLDKHRLTIRISKNLFGIAVTSVLWYLLIMNDRAAGLDTDLGGLAKFWLFTFALSILPWFTFGQVAWYIARKIGICAK